MDVIPAINCEDEVCVKKHLEMLRELYADLSPEALAKGEWVHFDVSDGRFNPVKTWNEPERLVESCKLKVESLSIEVHLMVEEPVQYIERWVEAGARRVIVHTEVVVSCKLKVESFVDCEVGLALLPKTAVEQVFPYLDTVRFVQLLAVSPGFSGQKFQEDVLEKIRTLRKKDPNVIIEVDGGITLDVARRVKEAGANVLVSSSYIWNSRDPKEAFHALQEV